MNNNSNTVIDLNEKKAQMKGTSSVLLQEISKITSEYLNNELSRTYKAIDDTLFKRSEVDTKLFDGLRELRVKQPLLMRVFLEDIESKILKQVKSSSSAYALFNGELALLNEKQLEEELAISRIEAAAQQALSGDINILKQRWSVISGGLSLDLVELPFGPSQLTEAFKKSLLEAPFLTMPMKIIMYRDFERFVMGNIGNLYSKINVLFAESGVLPNIKAQSLLKNYVDPSVSTSTSQDHDVERVSIEMSREEQQAWNELRGVLLATRNEGSGGFGPRASLKDLTEAISALKEIHNLLGQLNATGVAPLELKSHLLKSLGEGTNASKSLGEHEDVIDAVGLMFSHILEDSNLPAPVQALLARMQVAFLKVSVTDKKVFTQSNHPARLLLNALGDVGKGWSKESDRNGELYNAIKTSVDNVTLSFLDDPQIFEKELARLQSYLNTVKVHAEEAQQRSLDVAKAREDAEQAREFVNKELISRTAGKNLPEWVRELLLRHWVAYMLIVYNSEGGSSPNFRKTVFFVEKVVDSCSVLDDSSKKIMMMLTETLKKQFREGMAALHVKEEDVVRTEQNLDVLFKNACGELSVFKIEVPSSINSSDSFLNKNTSVKSKKMASPAYLKKAQELVVGDWLELTENNRKIRGRIGWIGSFSGKVLMVSSTGTRVGEKTVEDIAVMLELGTAKIIENKSLFDRAFSSILGKTK